jgi:N-acetylmuramoyl-L-alanine amidase
MFSAIPKRRELKIREGILQGVYEDNLRTLGKYYPIFTPRFSLFQKKLFVSVSLLLLTIIGYVSYANLSSMPNELTMPRERTTVKPSSLPGEKSVNPLEYRAFLSARDIPLSRVFGLEVKTIIIDPGHGGSDTGTTGKMGTREKDITLDIAKRLRERLKKYGHYTILMTREQDITLPLNKRVELANSSRADLFISIHLNYLPFKPINIIETYYFGPPSDAKTLRLAEQENRGSHYGLSEFKEIIEKMGETLKFQESKKFAAAIQSNLFLNTKKQNVNIQNFGVKRAPFVVLLGVDVPAVLAEVSCLSNAEEEIELNTETHRENIARFLEAGILDYLNMNKGEMNYEAKRLEERR